MSGGLEGISRKEAKSHAQEVRPDGKNGRNGNNGKEISGTANGR